MNTYQSVPRPEYPRPQFVRPEWLCLNGEWQFEIDGGDSGFERGLLHRELSHLILVPFCAESEFSGLAYTDFMSAVWYRRSVTIPSEWAGRQVFLHFQAVNYDTTVWVNGIEAVRHRGGFTPFSCSLEGIAAAGDTVVIVVRARHHGRSSRLRRPPSGNKGAHHQWRVTGIWQTVWMEPVPYSHLQRPRITPDVAQGLFRLEQTVSGSRSGLLLRATVSDPDGVIFTGACEVGLGLEVTLNLPIPEDRRRLWSVSSIKANVEIVRGQEQVRVERVHGSDPHLYDVGIELLDSDGTTLDQVQTYAGLRSISIDGRSIRINGNAVFQCLVLHQGIYPGGIMTAPSDEAFVHDIQLALAAGFIGARLYQNVCDERFLYHADRLGFLVWGEFPDADYRIMMPENRQEYDITFAGQWLEVIQRDYSHPCIIGWCPINEVHQELTGDIEGLDDAIRATYQATKAVDRTRPALDASGYSHRVPQADIFDCHDYEQDPDKFSQNHSEIAIGRVFMNGPSNRPWSIQYRGQPFMVSEFGGIWWNADNSDENSWGYGERPKTIEEFYQRFEGLCSVLIENPDITGYCYTQLTDIYQEQNGLYTFDRRPKFDLERIRRIQQRASAIEVSMSMDLPASTDGRSKTP